MDLTTGIKGFCEMTVEHQHTTGALGNGLFEVFSTPAMIALMEKTALESVLPFLEEGMATVGTRVDISHDAATPVGMKVRCESTLVEIDRKRLVFELEAFNEKVRIGHGRHERFMIDSRKFGSKT